MYSNEKHRENGIFDIILSVVFYIMIFCAPFVDVVVNGQIAETKTLAGFLKEHSDNTVSLILNIHLRFVYLGGCRLSGGICRLAQ